MDLVPRPASHWGGIGHFVLLNFSLPQARSRSGVQTGIVSFANSISTFKPAAKGSDAGDRALLLCGHDSVPPTSCWK